jgi:hypothetical protein
MKVNSNIEQHFPMDDEIIVSKSRLSSIVSQFPNRTEVQATSKHELASSNENGNESNIVETKMKQTEDRKQVFSPIPSVPNSPTNSQVIFHPCPFLRYSSYEILMDIMNG